VNAALDPVPATPRHPSAGSPVDDLKQPARQHRREQHVRRS
jgi:hypothetical protein